MQFQNKLLQWFSKNQRPLPWRAHYRPYEVWVSEVMLQQTQMDTVLPYFERWMSAFPSIRTLAQADEKKVLKLWEGLGYYSRARNLHQTAKTVISEHRGRFPEDYETILSLKGIGRYSAGAIASIAFNQDRPIVDGNVLRVLSRLYAIDEPIDAGDKEVFWKLQESLIPKGKARDFNQALMELGALVCTPQNPACETCPLKGHCLAFKKGAVEDFPVRAKRKRTVRIEAAALALRSDGRFFIHRRPVGKIMGGLWEFPEWKLARDKKISSEAVRKALLKRAEKEFGSKLESVKGLGTIKRNYTHHLETLHVFETEVSARPKSRTGWPSAWVSPRDLRRYPLSSAHAKILKLLIN